MPWDYSVPADDPADAVENLPTPEGRMLGAELARLTDLEEERKRERFPNAHPRCDDCALRAGTRPNGCPETLMDVLKALMECEPFYCHKGVKEGEGPKRLCAGYAILAEIGPSLAEILEQPAAATAAAPNQDLP